MPFRPTTRSSTPRHIRHASRSLRLATVSTASRLLPDRSTPRRATTATPETAVTAATTATATAPPPPPPPPIPARSISIPSSPTRESQRATSATTTVPRPAARAAATEVTEATTPAAPTASPAASTTMPLRPIRKPTQEELDDAKDIVDNRAIKIYSSLIRLGFQHTCPTDSQMLRFGNIVFLDSQAVATFFINFGVPNMGYLTPSQLDLLSRWVQYSRVPSHVLVGGAATLLTDDEVVEMLLNECKVVEPSFLDGKGNQTYKSTLVNGAQLGSLETIRYLIRDCGMLALTSQSKSGEGTLGQVYQKLGEDNNNALLLWASATTPPVVLSEYQDQLSRRSVCVQYCSQIDAPKTEDAKDLATSAPNYLSTPGRASTDDNGGRSSKVLECEEIS